jgi:leader peptidase (prepilin peptidase) / N-methyltransferase
MILGVFVVALAFVLGAAVGSFLNVVISRVPERVSVISPASRCPVCEERIRSRDNVPIASWVMLKGRCRHCGAGIPVSYLLVELATALVWAGVVAWAIGDPASRFSAYTVMSLVIATMLIPLAVIDLRVQRLPRPLVLMLYPVVLIGLALDSILGPLPPGLAGALLGALIGLAVWTLVIGGLWWFTRGRGMGFGDVTLAPALGASLGWVSPWLAVFGLLTAFMVGALVGAVLLLSGRARRGSRVPFGPFLALGWVMAVTVGQPVVNLYLDSLGLLTSAGIGA